MANQAPVLDTYTPLSFKAPFSERNGLAPTWVPRDDQRRLTAYKILSAYVLNSAREFLPAHVAEKDKKERREYGDAALLVDRIRAGVLGDDPEIIVEGADVDLPDEPELPPPPDEPGGDLNPIQARVAKIKAERWEQDASRIVDEWEAAWRALPGLQERQEWLRQWADDEQLWAKLHEGEGDTVDLGDGVYTLAWSSKRKRAVLSVYEPGLFFPVLDSMGPGDDFPTKVHMAWEEEGTGADDGKQFIHRQTWELVEVEPYSVPWSTEPATLTCLFSDGRWAMETQGPNGLFDLSDSAAEWMETEDGVPADGINLGIDFLPVLHIPNTPASRDLFGESALLVVAQLLDDISGSDTDVRAASKLAAGPMVTMSGSTKDDTIKIQPGTGFRLPAGGRMDVLDMSAGLSELRDTTDYLRDLLAVNGKVPKAVTGRLDPSESPSGVHLALSFSPFSQLIGAFRMTRGPKLQLLLKFVQRLGQLGGVLESGEVPAATVAFGSFLPSDRSAVVEEVTKLLQAHAISTQTGVQLLVAAGYTIEDARGEVQRIRADDTAAAKNLADATGSEELAAERLGLELPEAPAAPQLTLPPESGDEEDTETEGG